MNFNLPEPNPGDRISANLIREIIRAIKSVRPLSGPGMKISQGPSGTYFSADIPKVPKDRETLPWTFRCVVKNGQRIGGWTNCRLQIGLDASIDEIEGAGHAKSEYPITADGVYYVKVDLVENTWELKVVATTDTRGKQSRGLVPPHDFEHNKVNVFIGTVKDAVCTYSIHCIPVVYKYV